MEAVGEEGGGGGQLRGERQLRSGPQEGEGLGGEVGGRGWREGGGRHNGKTERGGGGRVGQRSWDGTLEEEEATSVRFSGRGGDG